jgi:hypothetical protein
MPRRPEYDRGVKSWKRATVAASALALGLLAVCASAQIHAAPPSVTSMGFGGRPFNGPRPSVTSLGPRGYTPGSRPSFGNSGFVAHGPHHRPPYPLANFGYFGVPYYGYFDNGYYDNSADAANNPPVDDNNVAPGYVPRPPDADFQAQANPAPPDDSSEPSTPTVLVFKDGHEVEVENYAIVGTTLYDLTEGHRRKVPLGDLDLTATAKQNDDRGIDFHLPGTAAAAN